MTPEGLQQIEDLYHSALEQDSAERMAFIDDACNGDEELRHEVESLLASHEQAGDFIEEPVHEVAARLIADNQKRSMVGRAIGHYEIIELLGAGGMGEVYLARDKTLGRQIAIKLLPAYLTRNKDRLRRFEQEARSASTLSHPNVCVIHEIGETEDVRHFITMEYVDGVTLRQHMTDTLMKLGDVLDVATQCAAALTAAHAAGIVHRDIKPENIMLRRDGYVKVLDFGLAKLTERPAPIIDTEAVTRALLKTDPGMVMGTVTYMSPEQTRGLPVDARTDIWSLGVVLYEMTTGRPPFTGETPSHITVAILEQEPAPIRSFAPGAPAELQRIVRKALTKDVDERYQTARDLLTDLKALRRELEVAGNDTTVSPPTGGEETSASGAKATHGKTFSAAGSAQASLSTRASSEYIVSRIKQHKLAAAIVVGLVALAVIGIAFGIYRLFGQKKTALSFQSAKFTRLTSTGKAFGAAISPDGKWLVHVMADGRQQSLWLRQVAVANSNTQIVPPAEVYYLGVAFSPDGNYVYYTVREKTALTGTLYQMPVLGGPARKLFTGINGFVAFSPDGKQMAYFNASADGERLMIANADGTGQRQLAMRHGNEFFYVEPACVSWSPDGKTLASPVGNLASPHYMSVVTVSVESGEIKFFTPQKWDWVYQVRWLADGKSVMVTASEQPGSPIKIWQIYYPSGEAQKITNDLNSYPAIGLTEDSSVLATVQTETVGNIWVMPTNDSAHATQITSSRNFDENPSWAPDGKIVYNSNAGGSVLDLYLIDSRGGNPKQLTANSRSNFLPSVSPDGRYIVFTSNQTGNFCVWRTDIDGSNPKQLTDKVDFTKHLSPDGQWIVYVSIANKTTIWKVGIDGGQPVQLTDKPSEIPAFSPDGKQIVCSYQEEPNAPWKLAIIPFQGGRPIKTLDLPNGLPTTNLRWTADGRAIIYGVARAGVSNLWALPVDGSPPKQLTNFTSDFIFSFDFSRDGKQLALSRGRVTSDVVLISNFK